MNFKIVQHNDQVPSKRLQYTFNMCRSEPEPGYDGEWFEDINDTGDLYCIDYVTNLILDTTP
jgi:hypothetical protein